ncbi:MAG TPA: tetratricopeptide repeat protein [Phototrophicaceae bacterium]|nr:tetratricopeptide repeat protein [Phototrophicaceae bacterium]
MDDLLKMTSFGGLSVTRGGAPVEHFITRKVDALLIYLACNPREHPREVLGELLWDDLSQERTMANLRTALSNLQAQLAPYLLVTRQTIAINPDSPYWVDANELDAALAHADDHWKRHGRFASALIARTEKALTLYQGSFLEGFHLRDARGFEGWMLLEQERFRTRVIDAYRHLADHALQSERYDEGIGYARRILELDSLSEEAARLLMLLLVRSGQRGAALAHYEMLVRNLDEELGVEPEAETRDLYEQIQAGEIEIAPAAPVTPHNLPSPATTFIERRADLDGITQRLEDPNCRLLTLTGTGGIGKTRLAIETARHELTNFRQGVYFVPLASVDSPDFLVQTLATTLNISFQNTKEPEQELFNYLRDRELLLVLDNFEHLLDAGEFVSRILTHSSDLKILTTSRERLNLQEECLYPVGSMALEGSSSLSSAAQLFVQSAQRVQPGFAPADHLPAIYRICELVDGLPLAIELAAAQVAVMTCEQVAEQIEIDYDVLTTSLRNVPERHRSLRKLIEQSIRSLDNSEADTLYKLAVFRDRFDFKAARSIAGANLPLLTHLVEKSFLRADTSGRYTMHELLRRYAYDELSAHGDLMAAQRAHCHYYTEFADNAGNASDYEAVAAEYNHICNALSWASETRSAADLIPLANAVTQYWRNYGYYSTAREWLSQALALSSGAIPAEQRARLLTLSGYLAFYQSDFDEARTDLDQGIVLWRQVDDHRGLASALNYLGYLNMNTGRFAEARACFAEVAAIAEADKNEQAQMWALGNLGHVMNETGDFENAKVYMTQSLAIARRNNEIENVAVLLCNLGNAYLGQGDYPGAQRCYEESLELAQQVGTRSIILNDLINLGEVLHNLGDPAAALTHYQEGLRALAEMGDKFALTATVESAAFALIDLGQAESAVRLLGACAASREALDAPILPREQGRMDKFIVRAHSQISDDEFAGCWNAGRALTLDQALASVLEAPQK